MYTVGYSDIGSTKYVLTFLLNEEYELNQSNIYRTNMGGDLNDWLYINKTTNTFRIKHEVNVCT